MGCAVQTASHGNSNNSIVAAITRLTLVFVLSVRECLAHQRIVKSTHDVDADGGGSLQFQHTKRHELRRENVVHCCM